MQRRSSVLLLKRALLHAPKRPMEGVYGAAAAAAATNAAPTANAAARPAPLPPRQHTPSAHPAATAAAGTPQSPARPASLVSPPASAAPTATGGNTGSGMRKKKIIRRIVKRKKFSGGGGSGSGAAERASANAASATEAAAPASSASSPAAGRAQAMLHEIRKQPEGEMEEEEEAAPQHHHTEQPQAEGETAAAATAEEEDNTAAAAQPQHEAEAEEAEVDASPSAFAKTSETDTRESTARRYAEDMRELHDDTDESAGTTTSSRKTAMVKGYRIDEVTNLCSPSDAIFARRLTSGGCQFFAWPGTPLSVASKAIMSMPDTIRTVHAVFGRPGTPLDIVMDIDCQVPQEYWTMTRIRPFQMKLLDDVLSVLKEEVEKIGESIETQVVLQSPNLKKASFHIHTKLKDAAFADVNSLHGFLSRFQERMPNVDMQIYRPHGMLRMFGCMKENHTSAIVVFDDPKWNLGFPGGKVSDEQAALHSICVRDPATFTRTLTFSSPRAYLGNNFNKEEAAADGEGKRLPPQVRLPLTEREAVANASRWLRMANETEVGEWRTWIGLGLCAYRLAHHFRNAKGLPRPAMEEMLDAWSEASRSCPLKYHQGECETRWSGFSPEKLGDRSDWWGAYKRLGRLEAAAMEVAQLDAAEAEQREKRLSQRAAQAEAPAAAAAAPAAPAAATPKAEAAPQGTSSPSSPSGNVAPASRKLKLKKRTMRHA